MSISFSYRCKNDFNRWSYVKHKFDAIVNITIFEYLSKSCETNILYKQFLLDSIIEILQDHYKYRVRLYGACNKLPFGRKAFIFISFLITYFYEVKHLLYKLLKLRFVYRPIRCNDVDCVDLAFEFPVHSFSISSYEDANNGSKYHVISSFGEYLKSCSTSKTKIFSVREYSRLGNNKERPIKDHGVCEYPRIKITTKSNYLLLFSRMVGAVSLFIKNYRKIYAYNLLIKIIYLRKLFISIDYKNIIELIEKDGTVVSRIFTPPFLDVGLLKYDEHFISKIINYNYSQNSITPPTTGLPVPNNKISETELKSVLSSVPISIFKLMGVNAVGYTEINNQIDNIGRAINDYMDCRFYIPDFKRQIEIPLMLGYESKFINHNMPLSTKLVAVFDVPPESRVGQLSRHLSGDRTCDFQSVEKFIVECFDECLSMGYSVVFKPKYSVLLYNEEYQNLIFKFSKKNIIIVSPYVKIETIANLVSYCISMPYTSTKSMFDNLNIPSIYYVPEDYRCGFIKYHNSQDKITFGKKELSLFLREDKH